MPKFTESERPKIRIDTFIIGDLVFKHRDLIEPKDMVKVGYLFNRNQVHPDIRCDCIPETKGNLGFSRDQLREQDFPSLLFGIYNGGRGNELVGGLNITRIRLIQRDRDDIQVSALVTPILPEPGSNAWMRRTFTIFQYLLDNKIPTETDGVTMHFQRLEMPEGSNEAFKKMRDSSTDVDDLDFDSRSLRLVEAPDTLPNGNRVFYIEKSD